MTVGKMRFGFAAVQLCTFTISADAWSPWWHGGGSESVPGDQLTVSTTSGHITGKIDPAYPNVRQFVGIPFAQPPVGDLRWEAPQALSQPDALVSALELPPSCNQYLGTSASIYTRNVLQFNLQGLNTTGSTSEDCLTASVWTPAAPGVQGWGWGGWQNHQAPLPVIIFFYGGGFYTGGQDVPYQIPTQWVNRTPNHIVVSFNYRLQIFGFPQADGLEDLNLGLLDQRAAVEWCKENIAAFGGDPERMIIWGQSAGAMSVDYYNFAYPDDPIVKGLIMDSGAVSDSTKTQNPASFNVVAKGVGCGGLTGNSTAQLACMRKVPALTIQNFVANYSDSYTLPGLSFGPVPDGKTVFANYTQRALDGNSSQLPAIIGTNAQDGVAFAPYNPNGPNATATLAALLSADCPSFNAIRLRQVAGILTYSYLYSGNFSNISPEPWMGAYHSSELPLIFGTDGNYRGPSTPLECSTSEVMQDSWVAFARDPVNGLWSQDWQPYADRGAKQVRGFGMNVPAEDVSTASTEDMCDGSNPKET